MLEQLFPIHPKLVHFPIALMLTALALDVCSQIFKKEQLHKTAITIFVCAVLFTPIVVWSGLFEQDRLHMHHPVLNQHKLYAFWIMWVSLASLPILWIINKTTPKYFRIIFTLLLLSLAILVTVTAHLGGRMVYEYGAGVVQ